MATARNLFPSAFACLVALSSFLPASAKTLYVSQKSGSNSNNGLSSDKPKATIQAAINAASSGDTILVGPGVYADDEGLQNKNHWWGQGRIHVLNKSLCIKSTEGPDVTHIVGKRADTASGYSAEGTSGYGSDVARCIIVQNATTNLPCVIQGFTLRDGSTNDRWVHPSGRGGALMDSGDGSNSSKSTYIVDCVISNCQGASSQIALGGTFVRCRIMDNRFIRGKDGGTSAAAYVYAGGSRFLNCLFYRNMTVDDNGDTTNISVYWTPSGRLVNCTVAGNRCNFWSHDGAYFYNTVSAANRALGPGDGSVSMNHFQDSATTRMMMNPVGGDFRLRAGTDGATGGDAAYLADSVDYVPMPEVDRLGLSDDFRIDPYVDLYGKAISTTGAIACGAVQETAVPAAGALVGGSELVMFPGMVVTNYPGYPGWMWPTNYPTSVKIGVGAGEGHTLLRFDISGHGTGLGNMRYPEPGSSSAWFIPPPSTNIALTINHTRTTNVKWADASNADDPAQDGSKEHPYAVLQDAVNALGADSTETYGVVFVRPGVYATGGVTNVFSDTTVRARVGIGNRRVRIVSTDGPESTFIVGAADPAAADGCGSNAWMTVSMSQQAAVQGFTLTGGHSGPGESLASGRGSLYSYGRDLHVTDSIISNNVGRNTALGTARFERCLITGNTGGSGVFFAPMLVSCLVGGNTVTGESGFFVDDQGGDHPAYIVSTTLIGDGVRHAFRMRSPGSRRVNSIIDRGGLMVPTQDNARNGVTAGCIFNGFLDYVAGGYTIGDPMLKSTSGSAPGDFRLYSLSPAFSVAAQPDADPTGIWWYLAPCDYYGNPWRFDASGRTVAGALQDTFSGGAFVGEGNGGITVEGGSTGYNDLAAGESITVGVKRGSPRPIAGFTVNGVTNLLERGAPASVTVTKTEGEDIAVLPVFADAWYVDALYGSDTDNTGYNPASAFKTLACALTNRLLVAGDKVMALPGEYDEGEMFQASGRILPSRAVVNAGITLESTDGADVTVIRGRASDVEIVPSSATYRTLAAGYGLGTNAVRCVYVQTGGVVRGFTLADGHTLGFTATGGTDHGGEEYNGGCCYGGTLERCIVTGGVAFRGGGAKNTTCVDCVFDGNTGMYGGGATSDSYHYGCLSKNNVCRNFEAYSGFFYWLAVEGCTAMDWLSGGNVRHRVIKNTLIPGKLGNWDWEPAATNFVNCALASDAGGLNANASYGQRLAQGEGCIYTNSSALAVDDDGRPVVGANAAVDRGDASLCSRVGDTDLSGTQRVYNGTIDIGALEGDWRIRYGRDICPRTSFAVTSAGENVVESEAGTVLLPSGETLSAEWASQNAKRIVRARVTGTGVLTISLGDDVREVSAADGLSEIVFPAGNTAGSLVAAYSAVDGDTGFAELIGARPDLGMMLLLR